jgi:hypothetical protein
LTYQLNFSSLVYLGKRQKYGAFDLVDETSVPAKPLRHLIRGLQAGVQECRSSGVSEPTKVGKKIFGYLLAVDKEAFP